MPLRRAHITADDKVDYFLEDFSGGLYNSRLWSVRGTGSALLRNGAAGGVVRVAASGNTVSYELYQACTNYSATSKSVFNYRMRLITAGTMVAQCGGNAITPNNTTNYVAWYFDSAVGSTWHVRSVSGGTTTDVDTGIAADTSYHEFKIIIDTVAVQFFYDGQFVTTITTNIPSAGLSPFVKATTKSNTTRNIDVDYVEAWNERV